MIESISNEDEYEYVHWKKRNDLIEKGRRKNVFDQKIWRVIATGFMQQIDTCFLN